MRAVLFALTMLTITPAMIDAGAVWTRKRVVVRDYTAAEWQPLVAETVAAFNRVMPKRVPRLRWRPMPPVPCESLGRTGGGITICVLTDPDFTIGADTAYRQGGREMGRRTRIRLSSRLDVLPGTVCHELMHALTGVPDPNGNTPDGLDSCVHGREDGPGAWDVAYARRLYRKHG